MRTVLEPSYRKRVGYQSALLGSIALLASAALVIGDMQTRDRIAELRAEDFRRSLIQVLPIDMHDNSPSEDLHRLPLENGRMLDVYRARREGKVSGVAFMVEGRGYAGPIRALLGVDAQGRVLGVRILHHTETPGLGDKIEVARDPWITGFDGLSLESPPPSAWTVRKDGGVFDQFTGATITPRAVVHAVRDGLELFTLHQAELLQAGPETLENPEMPIGMETAS